jgi:uncharacterized protein (TIRG00374 family)
LKITKNKSIYVIFGIVCLYIVIVLYSDVDKISEHFMKANILFLLLVLPIEISAFFVRSIRQKVLLDAIGVNISFMSNLKIFIAGLSMTITPGGSGGIIKSHFLKKNFNYSTSKTLPLVFVERFHDFLAVNTIIIFSLFFFYLWQSFVLVLMSSIFLIIIFSLMRKKKILRIFLIKMKNIKFISKLIPSLEFSDSLVLLNTSKTTGKAWIISVFSWLIEIFSAYLIFRSFGIDLHIIEVGQIVYTSILIGALSFIPAGIGFTEGSIITLMMAKGYELSVVSGMVLMLRILTIWFATAIGFIFTQKFLK